MALRFDNTDLEERTHEAITHPQVGDHYTEMYAFELYVVYVGPGIVATLECNRPSALAPRHVTMPDDGILRIQTPDEFRKRLSYNSTMEGYWVDLVRRGESVEGWYEFAVDKET